MNIEELVLDLSPESKIYVGMISKQLHKPPFWLQCLEKPHVYCTWTWKTKSYQCSLFFYKKNDELVHDFVADFVDGGDHRLFNVTAKSLLSFIEKIK